MKTDEHEECVCDVVFSLNLKQRDFCCCGNKVDR